MRIEAIQGAWPVHRPLPIVRLRSSAAGEIQPSRNRMIAATGAAPNVRAPAPARGLTRAEREFIGAAESVRPPPPAAGAAPVAQATPRAEVTDRPPPSLAIRPGEGPSETSRAAARQGFGEEVTRSYARAGASEPTAPSRRFDFLA